MPRLVHVSPPATDPMKRSGTIVLTLVTAVAAPACSESRYADDDARHCVDRRADTVVDARYCYRQSHGSPYLYYYGGIIAGRGGYYGSHIRGGSYTAQPGRSYVDGGSSYRSYLGRTSARSSTSRGGFGTTGRGRAGSFGG